MNNCTYCDKLGELRVSADENVLKKDIFVCDLHWKILNDPKTALPFIRGMVTLKNRGKEDPDVLKKKIDKFMNDISSWKRRH
jgi:hypothetical protein